MEQVLVPTLKPGEIVIMDSLGSHKDKAVRQAVRAAKARLFFLPKYSPDVNPIEQASSKLKHNLRKASARTPDEICTAIHECVQQLRCVAGVGIAAGQEQTHRLTILCSSEFDGALKARHEVCYEFDE